MKHFPLTRRLKNQDKAWDGRNFCIDMAFLMQCPSWQTSGTPQRVCVKIFEKDKHSNSATGIFIRKRVNDTAADALAICVDNISL